MPSVFIVRRKYRLRVFRSPVEVQREIDAAKRIAARTRAKKGGKSAP